MSNLTGFNVVLSEVLTDHLNKNFVWNDHKSVCSHELFVSISIELKGRRTNHSSVFSTSFSIFVVTAFSQYLHIGSNIVFMGE